jgi:hypothetical protein
MDEKYSSYQGGLSKSAAAGFSWRFQRDLKVAATVNPKALWRKK